MCVVLDDSPTFKQRTITLEEADTKQQLMPLPLDWVRRYPDSFEAEFKELRGGVLELRIVDPRSATKSKRYRIVRHHGSSWVSVPRPWLRDRAARNGDEVELRAGTDPEVMYLFFWKKPNASST
jgi:hypothetical protein